MILYVSLYLLIIADVFSLYDSLEKTGRVPTVLLEKHHGTLQTWQHPLLVHQNDGSENIQWNLLLAGP